MKALEGSHSPTTPAPASRDSTPGTSGLHVLVVDDDDAVRSVAIRSLKFHGLAATGARSGEEALEALQSGGFDCVVLDLTMPTLSGPATLKALRIRHEKLPVLLSSGQRTTEVDRLLEDFSKVSFLDKPFTPRKLVAAVTQLCEC